MSPDLARCAVEIASPRALPESKFPAYLLAMAEADWRIEAQLIAEGSHEELDQRRNQT